MTSTRTSRPRTTERIALAWAAVALITASVRDDRVSASEARFFRMVNDLPDGLFRPVWPVMQLGTLGAAPVASAIAWREGDHRLAARLLLSGTATWALSKAFKRMVGRPRPAVLLSGTRVRGADALGLGYLSGHAGVVAALAAAALPSCPPRVRVLIVGLVPLVGLSRLYVGAHLPADVAAGAALGLAVEETLYLLIGSGHPGPSTTEMASGRAARRPRWSEKRQSEASSQ